MSSISSSRKRDVYALAVEDSDRVVDDLRTVGEAALPARAQPGDANKLATAHVSDEEVEQLRGRAGGRSRDLGGSMRDAPSGIFSCHSPVPSSSRWRNVTPRGASRRSGVSKYVDVNLLGGSSNPSGGSSKPSPGTSFLSLEGSRAGQSVEIPRKRRRTVGRPRS